MSFLWEKAGVYQADYLTSADKVIPDWLVKGQISGRAELKLG